MPMRNQRKGKISELCGLVGGNSLRMSLPTTKTLPKKSRLTLNMWPILSHLRLKRRERSCGREFLVLQYGRFNELHQRIAKQKRISPIVEPKRHFIKVSC